LVFKLERVSVVIQAPVRSLLKGAALDFSSADRARNRNLRNQTM
jgi:hypothetical protein